MKAKSKVFIIKNLHLPAHLSQVNVKVELGFIRLLIQYLS